MRLPYNPVQILLTYLNIRVIVLMNYLKQSLKQLSDGRGVYGCQNFSIQPAPVDSNDRAVYDLPGAFSYANWKVEPEHVLWSFVVNGLILSIP